MNPEILARIMRIIAKTGERVIVIDQTSGLPLVLMNLTEYERLASPPKYAPAPPAQFTPDTPTLTVSSPAGMLDSDLAVFKEAKAAAQGDWGGDEPEEKFYMEPVE